MVDSLNKHDHKASYRNSNLNFELYELALDNLPFGISIQTKDRTIQYENETAVIFFGNASLHEKCYRRWNYLPGEGDSICKDCPATICSQDKKIHQILRKTLNQQQQEIYVEIQCIPILNSVGEIVQYLEIIKDVTNQENTKILAKYSIEEIVKSLEFSLINYGTTGSEIIVTDQLQFITTDFATTVYKLASFTYIGLFQNKDLRLGLYGPLPVLDYVDYSMLIFTFNLISQNIIDPRKGGKDNCMLLIFYKRDFQFIFSKRDNIATYITSKITQIPFLEEIDASWFEKFKSDIKQYLIELSC